MRKHRRSEISLRLLVTLALHGNQSHFVVAYPSNSLTLNYCSTQAWQTYAQNNKGYKSAVSISRPQEKVLCLFQSYNPLYLSLSLSFPGAQTPFFSQSTKVSCRAECAELTLFVSSVWQFENGWMLKSRRQNWSLYPARLRESWIVFPRNICLQESPEPSGQTGEANNEQLWLHAQQLFIRSLHCS